MLKKRFLLLMVMATLAGIVLTLIGPWPTYGPGDVQAMSAYQNAIAAIAHQASQSDVSGRPGRLTAGWAKVEIAPPAGTPLAGYGNRRGAPSTGARDAIWVKALALSDGQDTVVIVGSDMLIVPESIADAVRERVSEQAGVLPNAVLLNASHTHSGPGGFAPGYLAAQFAGPYAPEVVSHLVDVFARAITDAVWSAAPAALAYGKIEETAYIRNRTRAAPTDSTLNYLVVQRDDGACCYVVRYSAHATVLGGSNMQFSGDYPGFLQRAIEGETGAFALFLAGAVGSMGPKPPARPDDSAKAHAMGEALAARVLGAARDMEFRENVEIGCIGVPIALPPFQLRIGRRWRLSPLLLRMAGLDRDGWLHAVRIGDAVLCGFPADFSGESANDLQAWGAARGLDVWPLSFNGDYAGYISPDRYYATARKTGMEGYEMFLMSWCGPNQEAFFTGLCTHMIESLCPETGGGQSY